MCVRRFTLLYNIENVAIPDLVTYLQRLVRIYAIFTIVSIIEIATSYGGSKLQFLLSVIALVLYVFNALMIYLMTANPTLSNAKFPILSCSLLTVYNVIQMLALILIFRNIFALLSLLSIFVSCTTIYILYKLREKIWSRDNASVADIEAPAYQAPYNPGSPSAPPAVAVATPVMSPMSKN